MQHDVTFTSMRIAIDIRHINANPAGVGIYTKEIVTELIASNTNHELILFSVGKRREIPEFVSGHVRRVHISLPNKLVNRLLHLGLISLDRLVNTNIDRWFFPNLHYIRTEVPYVITAHDLSFILFPECYSRKMQLWHKMVRAKKLFQHARAIIAPSLRTKNDLIKLLSVDPEKISIVPHGVSTSNTFSENQYGKYLLQIGTIEPRKNHVGSILAYEQYRDSTGDNAKLIIVGKLGWKIESVINAMKQSKYSKDILWLNYVSEQEKWSLIKHAQCLLFPSLYEGFGFPVLEAMTVGTPVVTSHTGSISELVGDAAILVDPFNTHDIASGIFQLLSSGELQERLVQAGKKRSQSFSWKSAAEKTLGIICA